MNFQPLIVFGSVLLIAWLAMNIILSREVANWIPLSVPKRILLIAFIWLVPVVGFLVAYKVVGLHRSRKSSGEGGGGSVGGGALLGIDAIFNPGARHVIEAREEVRVEVQKDGEPYGNKAAKEDKGNNEHEDTDN